MLIKERLEFHNKRKVLEFSPDATVSEAAKEMAQLNYGSGMVVGPDGKPVGIVTERDFLRRVLGEALDPATTKLADVMTKELKLAKGDDDLMAWLRMMSNERFRHLPVVDDDGRVIAMMSQGDFVAYTWPEVLKRMTETTRASLGDRYYPYLVVGGVMLYTVLLLFLFR
ncbi:MAG: CBS domain-containing protein [Alphaproteobacteria bacterium]|nr:CBS domain-containing protein [Alphaproteobacteria bacterium]